MIVITLVDLDDQEIDDSSVAETSTKLQHCRAWTVTPKFGTLALPILAGYLDSSSIEACPDHRLFDRQAPEVREQPFCDCSNYAVSLIHGVLALDLSATPGGGQNTAVSHQALFDTAR